MPWFQEDGQYSDVGFDDAPDYAQSHPKAQPVTRMHDENGKTYAIPYGQEGYYASQNPNLQLIPSSSDQGADPTTGQAWINIPRALVQGAAGALGNQLKGLATWAPQVPGSGAWALDKLAGAGTYAKVADTVSGGIQSAANYIADPEKLQQQQRLSAVHPLRVLSDVAQSTPSMGLAIGAEALGTLAGGGPESPVGAPLGVAAGTAIWANEAVGAFAKAAQAANIPDDISRSRALEYAGLVGPLMTAQQALTLGIPDAKEWEKKALSGLTSNKQLMARIGVGGGTMATIAGAQTALQNYFLEQAGRDYQQKNPNYSLNYIKTMQENPLLAAGKAIPAGALFGAAGHFMTPPNVKPIDTTIPSGAVTPNAPQTNAMAALPAAPINRLQLPMPMEGDNFTQGQYEGQYALRRNNQLSPQEAQPEFTANQTQLGEMGRGMPTPQTAEINKMGNVDFAAVFEQGEKELGATQQAASTMPTMPFVQLRIEAEKRGLPITQTDSAFTLQEKINADDLRKQQESAIGTTEDPTHRRNAATLAAVDRIKAHGVEEDPVETKAIAGDAAKAFDVKPSDVQAKVAAHPDILKQQKAAEAAKAATTESKTKTQPQEAANAVQVESARNQVPHTGEAGQAPAGNVGAVDEGNAQIQKPTEARKETKTVASKVKKTAKPPVLFQGTDLESPDLKLSKSGVAPTRSDVMRSAGVPDAAHPSISSRLDSLQHATGSISGNMLDTELAHYGLNRASFANTREGMANETRGGETTAVKIRGILKGFGELGNQVDVHDNLGKVPGSRGLEIRNETRHNGGRNEAFYDPTTGRAGIIAKRLEGLSDTELKQRVGEILKHELQSHGGIDALFGGDETRRDTEMQKLNASMSKDPSWKSDFARTAALYGYEDDFQGRSSTVQEMLSKIAEADKPWHQKVIDYFKNIIEKLGIHDFADKDVRNMLARIKEASAQKGTPQGAAQPLRYMKGEDEAWRHVEFENGPKYDFKGADWVQTHDEFGKQLDKPRVVNDPVTLNRIAHKSDELSAKRMEYQAEQAGEAHINKPFAGDRDVSGKPLSEVKQKAALAHQDILKRGQQEIADLNKELDGEHDPKFHSFVHSTINSLLKAYKMIEPENWYTTPEKQKFSRFFKNVKFIDGLLATLKENREKADETKSLDDYKKSTSKQMRLVLKQLADDSGSTKDYADLSSSARDAIIGSNKHESVKAAFDAFLDATQERAHDLAKKEAVQTIKAVSRRNEKLPASVLDAFSAIADKFGIKGPRSVDIKREGVTIGDPESILRDFAARSGDKELQDNIGHVLDSGVFEKGKTLDDLSAQDLGYLTRAMEGLHDVGTGMFAEERVAGEKIRQAEIDAARKQDVAVKVSTPKGRRDLAALQKVGDGKFNIDQDGKLTYDKRGDGFEYDQEGVPTWNENKLGADGKTPVGPGPSRGMEKQAQEAYKRMTNTLKPTEGEIDRLKSLSGRWFKKFWAQGMKVSTLANIMDGMPKGMDVLKGAWYRATYAKMSEAETAFRTLKDKWTGQDGIFPAILKKYGVTNDNIADYKSKVIGQVGDYQVTLAKALAVYSHMQNLHNLKSLTGEFGNQMTEATAIRIAKMLSDSDRRMADEVIAKLPDLYEEMNKTFQSMGQTPPPRELGIYFPMMQDPGLNAHIVGGDFALKSTGAAQALLGDGFTKERSEFGKMVLDLDYFDAMSRHIDQVTRFISYAKKFDEVKDFIHDPEMRARMVGRLGIENTEQFDNWMKDIARPNYELANSTALGRFARFLRQRAVVSVLAYRASTALIQTTQMFQSIPEIGQGNLMKGWAMIAQDWAARMKEVDSLSKAVPERAHTGGGDVDLSQMTARSDLRNLIPSESASKFAPSAVATIAKYGAKFDTAQQAIAKYGMMPIQFMDHLVCSAVWLGAREKAYQDMMAKGMDAHSEAAEKMAVDYADHVIRTTQSSPRVTDLSQVQRGSELDRSINVLQGFFNSTYNLIRKSGAEVGEGRQSVYDFGKTMFWLVAANGIAQTAMETMLHGNPDQESLLKRMGQNTVASGFVGMPGISSLISWWMKGYQPRMLTFQSLQKFGASGIPGAGSTEKQLKNAVDGMATLAGLPKQASDSFFGAYDVISGQALNDVDAIRRVIAPQPSNAMRLQLLRKAQKEMTPEDKQESQESEEAQELSEWSKENAAEKRAVKRAAQVQT